MAQRHRLNRARCYGLIGDNPDQGTIFATYQPTWVGEYAGYNVTIDIGMFIGDYLIANRPQLHWDIYRSHRNGGMT
jgi:hypothetical protein